MSRTVIVCVMALGFLSAGPASAQQPRKGSMEQANQFFKFVDTNEDNQLDRAELAKALRGITLDSDQDEKDKQDEKGKKKSMAPTVEQAYLNMMDKDKDGRISKEEFNRAVKPQADQFARMFDYQRQLMQQQQQRFGRAQRNALRQQQQEYRNLMQRLQQGRPSK
jgi:hypothetical protein